MVENNTIIARKTRDVLCFFFSTILMMFYIAITDKKEITDSHRSQNEGESWAEGDTKA